MIVFDARLTFVVYFPFVALSSLMGRPLMAINVIAVTTLYIELAPSWQRGATPLSYVISYVLSACAVIVICEGLMPALAAAEADRRRAQSRNALHAALVRSSNDAIITKTLDGVITSWNPAAIRMLGYQAREAIGQNIAILFPPDRLEELTSVRQKITRGLAVEPFETVRRPKSGADIAVSITVSPLYDETGAVVGASKIMRDISKAKHAADALRDSEERLRFALQGAKAGTWRRDYLTGKYDWSPRFCEMHGLDPGTRSPSFQMWAERLVEEDRGRAASGIRRALDGSATQYDYTYRVRSDEGEIRWIELYGMIERQTDGSIRRTTGISLDVTERHHAIESLTQANDNLRRANDSLNTFSSLAAHDLQEPLRKVEQFGDLLAQEYGTLLEGDGALYIQVMRESARRMRALINALLDFSRAGNRPLTKKAVDLNDVMIRVLGVLSSAIEETGAHIEIGDLPSLYGDAGLVTQLFQNLVSNAIKYGKSDRVPSIRITAEILGPTVSIYVRDEGIGIAREHQDVIFEAFTRLNPREKVKGAGIGLAFCRTVCERHGWRLAVKSEPGCGSVFSVAAPIYEGSPAA